MEQQRVLILSSAVGSGHKIAAQAIENAFKRHTDLQVVNQDILDLTNDTYRRLSSDTYLEAVKLVPWFVGMAYQFNDEPFKNEEPLRRLWDQLNAQPVVKFIRDYQPHMTICTHYTPAGIVAQLMARGQLDTMLSVVTTDYDFQGMWLSRTFNRYFVAREEARARLIDFGVDGARVTVSGIPVSEAFSQPFDRQQVLERFELPIDRPLILVSAGAVGGGPAREIVNQLMRMTHDVSVILVCGSNAQLRRDVEAMTLPVASNYRILGYTQDMPSLLRAATVFVGKPGGLTASECMAAGTPMVIVTPIPGQEERNSDYLLEEGAAIRSNDIETIDFKLDQLLDDPERLERMRANARRIGRPDAASVIVETVLADEHAPVRYDWRVQQRLIRNDLGVESITRSPLDWSLLTGQQEYTLALYDDDTGMFFGTISPVQYRALRKQIANMDDDVVTTTITAEDLDLVRAMSFGSELIDRLQRRIHFRGPINLRRIKIAVPAEQVD